VFVSDGNTGIFLERLLELPVAGAHARDMVEKGAPVSRVHSQFLWPASREYPVENVLAHLETRQELGYGVPGL